MRVRGTAIIVAALVGYAVETSLAQGEADSSLVLRLGGAGVDFVADVAPAMEDGFVIAGAFSGTIKLSESADAPTLTSMRGLDGFLARFDSAGRPLWSARIGDRMNDAASAVASDDKGNVFVGGYFSGKCVFDAPDKPLTRQSIGRRDAWIARYSVDGKLQWVTSLGGTEDDEVLDIAADGAGGCLVTGCVTGLADIDTRPGSMLAEGRGGRDGFIIHLDKDGDFQWGTLLGGIGDDECVAVVRTPNGEICCLGSFIGTLMIERPDMPPIKLTSAGRRDAFMTRFAADHSLMQALSFGGTGEDRAAGIAIDNAGNVRATGRFEGKMRIGDAPILQSAGGSDAFVARLDPVGAVTAFSVGGERNDDANAIACNDDSVAVAGSFAGRADFDPGDGAALLKAKSQRPLAFLSVYDAASAFNRAMAMGEIRDADRSAPERNRNVPALSPAALCFDEEGRCIVVGSYTGNSDLMAGEEVARMESAGASDGFVLRLPAQWHLKPSIAP